MRAGDIRQYERQSGSEGRSENEGLGKLCAPAAERGNRCPMVPHQSDKDGRVMVLLAMRDEVSGSALTDANGACIAQGLLAAAPQRAGECWWAVSPLARCVAMAETKHSGRKRVRGPGPGHVPA